MKTVGLLLLFLTGLAGGSLAAGRLHARVLFLRRTLHLLRTLGERIAYEALPLRPLLESLCPCSGMPDYLPEVCARLRAGDVPAGAFAAVWAVAPCTEADRELLRRCTDSLGQGDRAGQTARLTATCRALEESLRDAQQRAVTGGRMCRTTGACAGAALVLLLL